ncbi:probable UDP-sugar transporter protein SLC35A4 [Dreissena polymorpha]|uniref:UDP-sugar transporter protein SLC35A4 n=1 Tax=Dreissena polymorpha TaxID=45954 RepID=A0A9D4KNU6_DREPO|nr:probable UDP-sugar transporter protein SLC35A4 [Dreissena polymorpha]XP_052279103.1 probable UDP-sugar transporter protein SLC35A4 [Dreissena polymorpha]XP_052279104.1 probable UDP-sugar transporter protein SLC35A4 [Dreissena polymorpha]XP_052279105.1 probable UDP-sugar transporter protein SLC35A4 [Dreissena polymorpha]XP_052279106.1 probable UDP-sugar transporter protein SLC35A4 [Dreissena polymorpha]XP_052279107.1 probable UDP-sugar transporter protein SLC35A4 [Dreissena polymorpha]XP_05
MDSGRRDVLPRHTQPTLAPRMSFMWVGMLLTGSWIYGSYSILVNLSQVNGQIPFSSAAVILMIELTKFLISFAMYMPEFRQSFRLPHVSVRTALSYSVPAVLYAFNNNIALYINEEMDPATFQVLSNLKIVTTALLYRVVIKRVISVPQWLAIFLLVLAGMCDGYGGLETKSKSGARTEVFITVQGLVMLLAYCSVSAVAAVYTEYILKKQLMTSLHVQNMVLYTYGCVLNITAILWQRQILNQGTKQGLFSGFSVYTWLIIITQAFSGLIMSVVFKHGSNLTRLFIISGAMLVSMVMSILILGTTLNVYFVIAAVLVTFAIYLYHQ